MENISFVGLKKLNEDEISLVKRVSGRLYNKVNKMLDNPGLIINVKKDQATGKRARYITNLRLSHPNVKNIISAAQDDWDLATSLHKTFDNLINEINHKLKKDATLSREKKF